MQSQERRMLIAQADGVNEQLSKALSMMEQIVGPPDNVEKALKDEPSPAHLDQLALRLEDADRRAALIVDELARITQRF